MKEIRIYTKDETLKELFRDIKRFKTSLILGDGRKRTVFNRGINNTIEKIKEYGLDLELGSNENIKNLKIRRDKITFKLVV